MGKLCKGCGREIGTDCFDPYKCEEVRDSFLKAVKEQKVKVQGNEMQAKATPRSIQAMRNWNTKVTYMEYNWGKTKTGRSRLESVIMGLRYVSLN